MTKQSTDSRTPVSSLVASSASRRLVAPRASSRTGIATVILALALVGCGSGTDKVPDVPTEPSDEDLLNTPIPDHKELPSGIQVSSNKPTKILLNGNDAGMTPKDIEDLKPGVYEITFLDEEQGNVTMTVELAPGEFKRVHHAPSPNAGDAKVSP